VVWLSQWVSSGMKTSDGSLSEEKRRLEIAPQAGAAPSVFIWTCGVALAWPSSAPPVPLIRGPRSVYLRASLALEAQIRLLLGQAIIWSVYKDVAYNWLFAGALVGAS
jgi:hypothetical protein